MLSAVITAKEVFSLPMPNPDHLAILKEGVARWNQWRRDYPDEIVDFSNEDLRGRTLHRIDLSNTILNKINLSKADLLTADFSDASLSGANLTEASLSGAIFNGANLSNANLEKADLGGAKFQDTNLVDSILHKSILRWASLNGANLDKADLSGALLERGQLKGANLTSVNLMETILTEADLSKADLSEALLKSTIFKETVLTGAIGLEKCRHAGPSRLDDDTVKRSGIIPIPFLRGCGLSDSDIERLNLPSSKYSSCFISYSTKDDLFARRLHDDLQAQGVRCWFAPEDLKIGDRIRPAIDDAIHHHDKLLIILSEYSVESQWVEDEVERALGKERLDRSTVLFPIRLDDSLFDIDRGWAVSIRDTRHIGDFSNWENDDAYQTAFNRLLRDLRAS